MRILALFALASSVCMAQQLHTAKVLVFSKTAGFRHESLPAATDALVAAGDAHDIEFDPTEDSSTFSDDSLAQYDAVLFLMTTKEVLNSKQTDALGRYLADGGNFIAIHSASDALLTSRVYEQAVGAYFDHHADLQNATITVVNKDHPSTSSLPDRWPLYEEIYYFKSNPRDLGATVLLSVDESTYTDQVTDYIDVQGSPHPLCWYQERIAGVDKSAQRVGRSWYTSLGHEVSIWSDDIFMSHIMGGITWALASGTTRAFDMAATVGSPGTTGGRPTGSSSRPTGTAQPSAGPPEDSASSRAAVGLAASVGAALAFAAI